MQDVVTQSSLTFSSLVSNEGKRLPMTTERVFNDGKKTKSQLLGNEVSVVFSAYQQMDTLCFK